MSKELARRLGNKMMVEKHNQQVKKYWQMQAIRDAEEARKRQREQQNVLNLYERATNPGLDLNEAARNLEINQARQAEQEAKRQYEGYKASDQRQEDWDKAFRDMAMRMITTGTSLDLQPSLVPDAEREYAAVESYYTQNRRAIEDRHVMEDYVAEVEAMSDEDRRLLETYTYGRNEWFDHQRVADSISAWAEQN